MSEEFEKIEFKYWNGDNYVPGIIAGHDFDLGITGVRKDNNKSVLFCLHGPISKLGKDWNKDGYKIIFEALTKSIKDGKVTFYDIDDLMYKHTKSCATTKTDINVCPFNQ